MTSYEKTYREILETARDLFALHGVKKTTLDDIAGAKHRTKTFIYHYFKNKDDLVKALIEAEGDEYVAELLKSIDSESDGRARLRAYVLARFSIFSRLGTFYHALREEYFEQYSFIEKARSKYDDFEATTLAAILAQGIRDGTFRMADPELVAHAILVALKGFELEWSTQDKEGFERDMDTLFAIFFTGIAVERR